MNEYYDAHGETISIYGVTITWASSATLELQLVAPSACPCQATSCHGLLVLGKSWCALGVPIRGGAVASRHPCPFFFPPQLHCNSVASENENLVDEQQDKECVPPNDATFIQMQ